MRFVLLFIIVVPVFIGCDTINTSTDIQDIVELRWQADGGGLFGLIQKVTVSQYDSRPTALFNLCRINADGSINKTITCDQSAQSDISYSVFPTADNATVITQLGGDLYAIEPTSGSFAKRYLQFHLIAASPDLHYVLGSISPSNRTQKTLLIVDISSSTTREVTRFDVSDLRQQPGIWLGDGRFAFTLRDSAGSEIVIYDTTGTRVQTIGGAATAFHNCAYNTKSKNLYFRTQSGNTTDYSVEMINLATMVRTILIPDIVESFDVTSDDGLMVYNRYVTSADSLSSSLTMFARNLLTGNESVVTNDVLSLAVLSPVDDRVAYIHRRDLNFNEVYVRPLTRP